MYNILVYVFLLECDDNIDIARNDMERKYKHAELKDVMQFLKTNNYPPYIHKRNDKSNFRKQCKPYIIENGILVYKKTKARVILDNSEKIKIMKMIHSGSNESEESSALSSHRGRDTTQRIIKKRLTFYKITKLIDFFIQLGTNHFRFCIILSIFIKYKKGYTYYC